MIVVCFFISSRSFLVCFSFFFLVIFYTWLHRSLYINLHKLTRFAAPRRRTASRRCATLACSPQYGTSNRRDWIVSFLFPMILSKYYYLFLSVIPGPLGRAYDSYPKTKDLIRREEHLIRFTMKRKSRDKHKLVISAALGITILSCLLQQAALDRSMILWSDMLNFSLFS